MADDQRAKRQITGKSEEGHGAWRHEGKLHKQKHSKSTELTIFNQWSFSESTNIWRLLLPKDKVGVAGVLWSNSE